MADLNSTLVRGNLRVTDEITTGSVTSPKVILNDVQHRISQEDGTTITRYNGATIAVPNISGKGAALLTDEGNDYGLLYIGSDGALIANSGDTGYVLRVHDKDTGTDILQVCQTNGTSAFNSNLNVNGTLEATSITESGTALSSKYLGINSNAASASIPYGFSSRGTSDWSGVSGTMITDWSTSAAGDVMFKDDGGKLNVITDGYFYQGIDIYGSSKRVLDEYDISHTTWGNAGYAGSAGNTPLLLYQDTRDAAVSVSDAVDYNGIKIEFKNKASSSIPSTGTWTALITLDGYSDSSGGYPSQLGFSMSDLGADRHLYMRSPVDGSTWGAWKTIAFHGDNISNFNNDSGYITSSGSCTYATSAGNADTLDNHDSSYFAVASDIPATHVIPAETTANKILVSTTTSGTAAWSSFSSAGFLKTNSSGVVSVDTTTYVPTTGVTAATGKAKLGVLVSGLKPFQSGDGYLELSDTSLHQGTTTYFRDRIEYGGSTLALPTSNGTLALTSDIKHVYRHTCLVYINYCAYKIIFYNTSNASTSLYDIMKNADGQVLSNVYLIGEMLAITAVYKNGSYVQIDADHYYKNNSNYMIRAQWTAINVEFNHESIEEV